MQKKINFFLNIAKKEINESNDIKILEKIKKKYLGKKGLFISEINNLSKLSKQDRPFYGNLINTSKKNILNLLNNRKQEIEKLKIKSLINNDTIDISLPGRKKNLGNLHPINYNIQKIETFFNNIGFSNFYGKEIESEYYNFHCLNISKYHPSRTEHDTLWINNDILLRTQTSNTQIRVMQKKKPPIKIITSGKVYRNDYDNLHTPMFHQVEGFIVDKNISFAHLKDIIIEFLIYFFEEKDVKIRFRPSYFPFTEPSAEVDIFSKDNKWIEILGCGMIHPKVLENVKINSDKYSGFAFGIGVERLILLRYGIKDLRFLFENDLRFLKQFK